MMSIEHSLYMPQSPEKRSNQATQLKSPVSVDYWCVCVFWVSLVSLLARKTRGCDCLLV